MNCKISEFKKVIISNRESIHNYFAWPSLVRLKDGRLAAGCSGFRLRHICPFGKGVLCFSSDEGTTWTKPAPVIDTVLDDRDIGLCTFGKSGLIVTSFNNTLEFQRKHAGDDKYSLSYIDKITVDAQNEVIGSVFTVSYDNGTTFGKLHKSPVTSPHGPVELNDGSILWIGRTFSDDDSYKDNDCIKAYRFYPDGNMEYLGQIENISDEHGRILSCEPHAIELPNGNILCLIRMNRYSENPVFTMYKTVSSDGGRTWTKPEPVCGILDGAPPHLMLHSSGALICSYGHREKPYGIRFGVSLDFGETWDFGNELCSDFDGADLGYPATVELSDGSLLTVFYAHENASKPAEIMQIKWKLNE